MPCNTIQQVTVELGKVNQDMLMSALKSLNLCPADYNGFITFSGGYFDKTTKELQLRSRTITASEIKQAYSAEVVKSQAKRFGWQLKETGKYQYQIVKR